MVQNQSNLQGATLSANETFAHETSIRHSELHTNSLRFYNEAGKRRRRPSDSLPLRQELITQLQLQYTAIRVIKIKDSGTLFMARIKTRSGRIIHHTAYSLPNLAALLCEGLSSLPA